MPCLDAHDGQSLAIEPAGAMRRAAPRYTTDGLEGTSAGRGTRLRNMAWAMGGPIGRRTEAAGGLRGTTSSPMLRRMHAADDPYLVLQVHADAGIDEIRAAYRALARKHHPDVGGSDKAMARLNVAWGILSHPAERARYDRRCAGAAASATSRSCQARPFAAPAPSAAAHAAGQAQGQARAARSSPAAPTDDGGSTVLSFGRYVGWSLAQVAGSDPDYLEWLARTPIGRSFQREIGALLAARRQHARERTAPASGRRASWGNGGKDRAASGGAR